MQDLAGDGTTMHLKFLHTTITTALYLLKKIGNATIGVEEMYTIKIVNDTYIFTFGETTLKLPRLSTTTTGIGYKLYPYFGGTETAPHDIKIWIEEL